MLPEKSLNRESAQEHQKQFYNQGFLSGNGCPFGEGVLQRLHWEKRIRFARRFISPEDRVMDLGCGDGTVARALANFSKELVGIDISEECINRAEQNNAHPRIRYILGPLEEFQETERFDVVLMYEVVEHIYDPASVLRQIRGILKPNGLLVLSTPNFSSLVRRLKKMFNPIVLRMGFRRWDEIVAEHIREYTYREMLSMLSVENFFPVKKDGVILVFPFTEISKRITKNEFLHRLNFMSGSIFPPLAVEMYVAAKMRPT